MRPACIRTMGPELLGSPAPHTRTPFKNRNVVSLPEIHRHPHTAAAGPPLLQLAAHPPGKQAGEAPVRPVQPPATQAGPSPSRPTYVEAKGDARATTRLNSASEEKPPTEALEAAAVKPGRAAQAVTAWGRV